jgi:hypothetical protein
MILLGIWLIPAILFGTFGLIWEMGSQRGLKFFETYSFETYSDVLIFLAVILLWPIVIWIFSYDLYSRRRKRLAEVLDNIEVYYKDKWYE